MRKLCILILCCSLCPQLACAENLEFSQPIVWEVEHMAAVKSQLDSPDDQLRRALRRLRHNANEALRSGPHSVVHKKEVPPSGDKHDYLSYSRYWWPNPDTEDGLPYVRYDGKTNVKMRAKGDRDRIGQLFYDVETLTLAYYLFDEPKYAQHASLLMRTWFLDADTRMNPNLNYGQAVLGRSEGRGVGIIDTRGFIVLLDCVALLKDSDSCTEANQQELRNWFSEFLVWLRESKLGKDEREAENNHGSWYAAQISRIALFVGEHDFARKIVEHTRDERIPDQFTAEGSQPYENERTKSLHYSFFNLSALSVVARVGEELGIDLWNHEPSEGGSLKVGLTYLLPYLAAPGDWPHKQIDTFSLSPRTIQLLRMASTRYQDRRFREAISRVDHRREEMNYAPLVCAKFTGGRDGDVAPGVTVVEDQAPTSKSYQLPDISNFTSENIRQRLPTEFSGVAEVGPADGEKVLSEAFRRERGEDLKQRQRTDDLKVIKISGGAIKLTELVRQIDDEAMLALEGETVTLRRPILIQPSGTLIVDSEQTSELRLSTDRGAFVANAGTLFVLGVKVTSWDEKRNQADKFDTAEAFRPYISSYIRSQTYLADSTFEHLGYHAPTAYGLSFSSQPERNRGEPSSDWPTGQIVGNVFRGLYYGFYSYEARDVAIIGNTYDDSVRYGIDPHDRSTRLIIAKNIAKRTRERHGIIGSREVFDSFIFRNESFDNTGSGIMLDRQCSGNVVAENHVYDNGQGIAVYESADNLITNNWVLRNEKSGVRVRNSTDIVVQENVVVGNGDYGFEIYSKRLADHDKRAKRGDLYDPYVEVAVHSNHCTGNGGGCMKGNAVQELQLSDFRLKADRSRVEQILPKTDGQFDSSKDENFGSELKPYTDELQPVFTDPDALVHYRTEQ